MRKAAKNNKKDYIICLILALFDGQAYKTLNCNLVICVREGKITCFYGFAPIVFWKSKDLSVQNLPKARKCTDKKISFAEFIIS